MASGDSEQIKIHCACGAGLKVPPKAIGKKIKCPKCETVFVAAEEESPFALTPLDTYDEDAIPKAPRFQPPKQASPPPPPATNKPTTPCPLCGKPIAGGAVMCVACGYDTRTGRRVATTKISVPVSAAARLAKSAGTFLLGCMLSGIGAVVGAAIWLGIAVATNLELGYIAWALGLLAGAGMALGYRQYNTRAGLAAAGIAFGGILLGKAAFFIFLVYTFTTGDTQDVKLLRGHLIQRFANEELDKRGVWDPKEREKQGPAVVTDVSKRVRKMNDAEVLSIVKSYQEEEASQEERYTETGILRSRLAWHESEREAETKGMNWNDPQREKLADKNERKLLLLPESQLKVRKKELDLWEKEGRWGDAKYVRDRLVYEFVEEDLRTEPPPGMEELNDLEFEEWNIPEKIWRERYQIALQDVKEMTSDEHVAKLKEVENKRIDDEIRDRLAYHRAELKGNRDGLSRYDWDARRALTDQHRKELDAITHEQLAEESTKLDEWEKNGKTADAAWLRDELIYNHIEFEVETRRAALPEDTDSPYWTPNNDEWKKLYADATAKVDAIPPDQYPQKIRDLEARQEQLYIEQQEASERAETKEVAGSLARVFFKSMLSPMDILFILLALTTAYRIGSHGFSKNQA